MYRFQSNNHNLMFLMINLQYHLLPNYLLHWSLLRHLLYPMLLNPILLPQLMLYYYFCLLSVSRYWYLNFHQSFQGFHLFLLSHNSMCRMTSLLYFHLPNYRAHLSLLLRLLFLMLFYLILLLFLLIFYLFHRLLIFRYLHLDIRRLLVMYRSLSNNHNSLFLIVN